MLKHLLIFSFFTLSFVYAQKEMKVDSKVTQATVFKDRAMVTREAKLDLPKGESKIVISNLTENLKDETVRVSAEGAGVIKILDVKVERKFTTEYQQSVVKGLQAEIDSLKNVVQIAKDNIATLYSKKDFVESLKAEAVKYANQKILLSSSSTKSWNEMLSFVENNLNDIYSNLRKYNEQKDALEVKINKLQLEINSIGNTKSKNFKEIIINVENEKQGEVTLFPSYVVENASWYPLYDARVISSDKEVEIDYYGTVHQATGENWEDIKLTLSTAEPLTVKSIPVLDRWFLDTRPLPVKRDNSFKAKGNSQVDIKYDNNYGLPMGKGAMKGYVVDKLTGEPLIGANVVISGTNLGSSTDMTGSFFINNIPQSNYSVKVSYLGYSVFNLRLEIVEKQTATLIVPLDVEEIQVGEVTVTAQQQGQMAAINQQLSTSATRKTEIYSDVYAKELSTTFEVKTKNTIPSDNTPHKVTISKQVLPLEFQYTSIPKIVPKVYLKGKIVNTNTYPWLDGEINIFVDNDFINRTSLRTVVPTDTPLEIESRLCRLCE